MSVRKLALTAASVLTLAAAAAPAVAAPNPAGTGQPGVAADNGNGADCSTTSSQPNGFGTGGFTNAGNVYANPAPAQSGVSSGNPDAVSEYDIACYQVSQH
jgi:hypothetical protein